jgi:hypothetical protein
MTNDQRTAYITRDSLLKLLSDDELARVSNAETADHLAEGEEYLDLEHLDQGVCLARGATTPMGRVLARKSVHENTWSRILAQLASPGAA